MKSYLPEVSSVTVIEGSDYERVEGPTLGDLSSVPGLSVTLW